MSPHVATGKGQVRQVPDEVKPPDAAPAPATAASPAPANGITACEFCDVTVKRSGEVKHEEGCPVGMAQQEQPADPPPPPAAPKVQPMPPGLKAARVAVQRLHDSVMSAEAPDYFKEASAKFVEAFNRWVEEESQG